jgi:cytochrome c553
LRIHLTDASHLVVLVLAFTAALLAFLALRYALVPAGFGSLGGHYRGPAVAQVAASPISFAGMASCVPCHDTEATSRAKGKHRSVACEACHGPLARHAEDPAAVKPARPETSKLCASCHEKDRAKPGWFAQVATAEHSGGADCKSCHAPHSPDPDGGLPR